METKRLGTKYTVYLQSIILALEVCMNLIKTNTVDFAKYHIHEVAKHRDHLMSIMTIRNNYSKQNQFQCSYGHLTIVLRQTWEIFDQSFHWITSNYFELLVEQLLRIESIFNLSPPCGFKLMEWGQSHISVYSTYIYRLVDHMQPF